MNIRRLALFAQLLTVTAGCAQSYTRGVVAMKIDNTTAHICIRRAEVSVGDKIRVYRNVCTRTVIPRSRYACDLKQLSEGTITHVLNEHYAEATFEKPVDLHEGDLVEKIK